MLKLNVLYNAVYLSRSIRPNKYPKIEFEIESKVRHSLLYIPLPFERQIQTSLRTWLCVILFSALLNEQKSTSICAKRAKKCHIWCIFTQFSTKKRHFYIYNNSKSSKLQGFWINSRALVKKLKDLEKKLKLFSFKTQRTGSDQLHPLP